ncbi:hypothetical protein TNCT_373181 [Trichonephila clavata]|uniref:Uncharacterized protein n=1 Tax=Trichonephila clavata TaxID=2740835 RepID=A0A8X6HG45_TRICU|nr:hypothetical protein TNCT_373181 [Trichonephila clavata]
MFLDNFLWTTNFLPYAVNSRMFRRSHVFVCIRKNYCGYSGRSPCRFNAMGSFVRKRPYSDEENSYENASNGRAARHVVNRLEA